MNSIVNLYGIIEKVIYKSPENGFTVCALKVSARETVTVTGTLPSVHRGESVSLSGSWGFHPKFGRQFIAKECTAQLPTNVVGIKKYLSSGLIKGIGQKFAKKLVDRFGEKTLEIIDEKPQRLFEVDGVGKKRVEAIINAWKEQKSISQVMVFLQARDVSTAFAVKIYKTYGQNSLAKIQENPYRLVGDIWGIGFKTADTLALKLGFTSNSLYRIAAGIVHCISEVIGNGHLYAKIPDVKRGTIEILELSDQDDAPSLVKEALHNLYNQEKIKVITHDEKHYITLPQYYFSEKGIANKIKRLNKTACYYTFDYDKIYKEVVKPDARGIYLNEDQQRGIISCLQNKISIITGGPGTGKTTLIKKLLEVLEINNVRFYLAAPTGRAAKRMFEGTGKPTKTLHRLLEFTPAQMGFSKNEQNSLDLDFLIVDEASMIDVFLMNALLRAFPHHAQLVFLGDVDQLPSVGAGNVLNDLIASKEVSVVRLTQIFRQAEDSLIVVNAHRINNGEFPISFQEGSKRDFAFIKEEKPENTFLLLKEIYQKKFPRLGIDVNDSVVLVPMNKGIIGTNRLNQELQQIINPPKDETKQIMRFGQIYGIGDKVMQIKNNYDKSVFNGDMGVITDVDCENKKMMIMFGDRELSYDFGELDEIVLSYAISIHKSQGSEFQAIIIPIFMQHYILLQRNLIYTAVTRAKKLCILIGQPKAIAMGIKNNKGVERITFLKEFLTTDLTAY